MITLFNKNTQSILKRLEEIEELVESNVLFIPRNQIVFYYSEKEKRIVFSSEGPTVSVPVLCSTVVFDRETPNGKEIFEATVSQIRQ